MAPSFNVAADPTYVNETFVSRYSDWTTWNKLLDDLESSYDLMLLRKAKRILAASVPANLSPLALRLLSDRS